MPSDTITMSLQATAPTEPFAVSTTDASPSLTKSSLKISKAKSHESEQQKLTILEAETTHAIHQALALVAKATMADAALSAVQPCIAAIENIPDYFGVFEAATAMSPMNLFYQYAMEQAIRFFHGDYFKMEALFPLFWMVYSFFVKLKNLPWMSLYNKYTIPCAFLGLVGGVASTVWMTDKLLNIIWLIVTWQYLLPLYAVLAVRARNSMVQWSALLFSTRWIWKMNTVMIRSLLSLITASPWIALPTTWIYAFFVAWCLIGITHAKLLKNPKKRINAVLLSALAATNVTNTVHWIGYSRSLSVMSVTRCLLLLLVLFLAQEMLVLKGWNEMSSQEARKWTIEALGRALHKVITLVALLCTLARIVLGEVFAKLVAACPKAARDGGVMKYAMALVPRQGKAYAKIGILRRSKLTMKMIQPMRLAVRKA
jgi:hypothetical protein